MLKLPRRLSASACGVFIRALVIASVSLLTPRLFAAEIPAGSVERDVIEFVKRAKDEGEIDRFIASQGVKGPLALQLRQTVHAAFELKKRGVKPGSGSFLASLRDEMMIEEAVGYVREHNDDKAVDEYLKGIAARDDEAKALKQVIAYALTFTSAGAEPDGKYLRSKLADHIKQEKTKTPEQTDEPTPKPSKITQAQFMDFLAVLQASGAKVGLQISPADGAQKPGVVIPLTPTKPEAGAQASASDVDRGSKGAKGAIPGDNTRPAAVAADLKPMTASAPAETNSVAAAQPEKPPARSGDRDARDEITGGFNFLQMIADNQKPATPAATDKADKEPSHVRDYYRTYTQQGMRVVGPYYIDTSGTKLELKRNGDQYKGYVEWALTNSWAWNPLRQEESAMNHLDDPKHDWGEGVLFNREENSWRNGFDYHVALGANFGSKSKASATTIAGEGDITAQVALEKHVYRGVVPGGGAYSFGLGTSLSLSTDSKNLSVHRSFFFGPTATLSFNTSDKKERALLRLALGGVRYDNVQFVDNTTYEVAADRDKRPKYIFEGGNVDSASLMYPYGENKFIIFGGNVVLKHPHSIVPWSFWIGTSIDVASVAKAFAPSSDKKDNAASDAASAK